MRHLFNTEKWSPYLDMLFSIFLMVYNTQLTELPKDIPSLLKDLAPQLVHLEHVCDDSHIRERIIEIAFHIPIPVTSTYIMNLLRYLLPLYVKALSGPDTLQRSGGRGDPD